MKNLEQVQLRCDDKQEAVVFTQYNYGGSDISYEITVEDSYIGGDYQGLFGRFKRAWRAFTGKPVCYTGIFTEDSDKMQKFLKDCLAVMETRSTDI
jgi:hypothetical protein